jgi:hypothetical protein
MAKYGHASSPVTSAGKVDKTAIKKVEAYLTKTDRLTIVLGAGTSRFYNLDDWNTLLKKLYEITRKGKVSGSNLDLEFEILKSFNDNLSLAQYIIDDPKVATLEELRKSLYHKIDLSTPSNLHSEIINLINRGKKIDVITFNFDGILEHFLDENGLKYTSSYGQHLSHSSDLVNIYHVHGYLPISGKITDEIALTFSEKQYIAQYNDVYSWQNQVQLAHYSNNPCIFIGLSFSDPNQKKLLSTRIKKDNVRHFRLEVPFRIIDLNNFKSQHFNDLKINTAKSQLSVDLINDSKLELSKKLGVELLNFNNFDEIPNFISKIK